MKYKVENQHYIAYAIAGSDSVLLAFQPKITEGLLGFHLTRDGVALKSPLALNDIVPRQGYSAKLSLSR